VTRSQIYEDKGLIRKILRIKELRSSTPLNNIANLFMTDLENEVKLGSALRRLLPSKSRFLVDYRPLGMTNKGALAELHILGHQQVVADLQLCGSIEVAFCSRPGVCGDYPS